MLTNLYCHNCTNRVGIEAEPCNIRVCPECASENITLHVPVLDFEDLIDKVVEEVVNDPDYDYNETTQIIEELAEYLKGIAFHRKYGAHIELMMHLALKEGE
jgi:hypothetical protein